MGLTEAAMLSRRSLLAAAILAPAAAQAQAQQASPSTIQIINPFPAGGASDSIARLLQPGLQARLGATVIVENRPGASDRKSTRLNFSH